MMSDDKKRHATGMEARGAVLGADFLDGVKRKYSEFNEEFQQFITRYAWGEIWTRPGLPRHPRSLLTLGFLVALHREEEFSLHCLAAFNNGVTRDEIYCGVPAANSAFKWAQEVFTEMETGQAS